MAYSYSSVAMIDSVPAEYRGTVSNGTDSAKVAGASIKGELVTALYGQGTAYSGSFYITQTDVTRLSLTAGGAAKTLTLGGSTQSVRLIGSQPFAGGLTRWDYGPTL